MLNTNRANFPAREANKTLVLSLIRKEREISRVELAQRMQMSRSAISMIVGELLDEGWVIESGEGKSIGGRKPVLLAFNEVSRYLLGIDIGLSHISVVVTDLRPRLIYNLEQPFAMSTSPDVALPAALSIVRAALSQARVDASRLVGVGAGVPAGMERWPGWKESLLAGALQKAFKAPLILENNTDLAALGEMEYGVGRGISTLAYVKVGTHLSRVIVRGGKTVHTRGGAGEFAHQIVDVTGPQCDCGKRGCLETTVSGSAIARRAQAGINAGYPTQLRGVASWKDHLSVRDVAEAARMGDSLSRQILLEAGQSLGTAVAEMAASLNLRRVIIGGGVVQAGSCFLAPLRKAVWQRVGENPRFDIERASLGRYSAALGAVALVCRQIFAAPVEENAGYPVY
jgi:predicted NBD/HSP70 family sugar kinase